MTPRLLTVDDLPACVDLLTRAGLAGGAANIGRYLRWQPDGCFGLELEGALVGTVTLLAQPPIGFVGCMAVAPERQGTGLGRLLLEHAHTIGRRWGLTTFGLEATESGAVLYRKLGYVTEHGSVILQRPSPPSLAPRPSSSADLAAVLDLDRAATGADRTPMIRDLASQFPGDAISVAGTLAAWCLLIGERLGPMHARDVGAGRALVERYAPATSLVLVPGPNETALRALIDAGFVENRRLERMWLGRIPDANVALQWTLASPGAG